MKVSFARQVKEEVVFNDFDICCQKAILSAIIKVNGTLSLSNQGLLLTIRTENAKIASKAPQGHCRCSTGRTCQCRCGRCRTGS